VRQAVLRWGDRNRRDLPWRATRDSWAVLVSEVMLQQTQVSRVIEPWQRFLARFPTPPSCAAAGAAEVVRSWEGLGYNRRALNLHRAAVAVTEHHGGTVPSDLPALLALPGVGPYTARAVQVFAFEMATGVVDTNVGRLLARAVAGRPMTMRQAQELADRLVPPRRSWAYNQALFDLGAEHCRASGPACDTCPLRRCCRWFLTGRLEPDPARSSAGTGRRQAAFTGSDRQGRGRLVDALRHGAVPAAGLAAAAGWPDDPDRAHRVAGQLVAEGLARLGPTGRLELA
jgi:A/G-specific adenine glycosylase